CHSSSLSTYSPPPPPVLPSFPTRRSSDLHSRFSWEGTGHRECAANVRDRDIPAAIDGYVSANIFRGHRATLDVQHRVALDLLHVDVAVFGGKVHVTGPLFHGDVAVAGRDRQIPAGRQLHIQVEMSAIEVAAAEVQDPYVALLFKLRAGRLVQAFRARLRFAAQRFLHHHMRLIIRAGLYLDVAPSTDNSDLLGRGHGHGEVV